MDLLLLDHVPSSQLWRMLCEPASEPGKDLNVSHQRLHGEGTFGMLRDLSFSDSQALIDIHFQQTSIVRWSSFNLPLEALLIFADNPNEGLTGFREFPANWALDWNLFMTLVPRDPADATRTQLAYRIDTSLVNPLGHLPPSVAQNPSVLAQRNLERGWRMRLPNGQDVARAMGIVPLDDERILIGKFTGDPADIIGPIATIHPAFRNNCPLWTYVLAETIETDVKLDTTAGRKTIKTRKLGPVGGRIVAEVFAGLLLGDSNSYLAQNPLWTPSMAIHGVFGLRELIAAALSDETKS